MCLVHDADGDWTELADETRRARKEHRCSECGRTIAVGESYQYIVGKSEGELCDSRCCAHCRVAREWLSVQCHGYLQGGVQEDIDEHAQLGWLDGGLLPHVWLLRMVVGMRRGWQRFDGHGLMPVPTLHPPIEGPRPKMWR